MNHHFLRGIGASLSFHGIVLFAIVYIGSHLPEITQPLVIDFSIENSCAVCPSCNCSEESTTSVQEQITPTVPVPQPKPMPAILPAQQESPVPKPQQMMTQTKPSEPRQHVEKSGPKKPATKVIVPIQTKKYFPVEKKAPAPAIKQIPVTLPTKIPDDKDTPSRPISAKNLPEQEMVAATMTSGATPQVETVEPSMKERYIKAHFTYIRDSVQRNISYPNIAQKMGWAGKVMVAFTIREDGRVEDIRILQSCGFAVLDKSAVNTIERSAPFPRPPVSAEITLPITFRLH